MIKAVESGAPENAALWAEWKRTILDAEQYLIKKAFFAGDDSDFHFNVRGINSVEQFLEYYNDIKE